MSFGFYSGYPFGGFQLGDSGIRRTAEFWDPDTEFEIAARAYCKLKDINPDAMWARFSKDNQAANCQEWQRYVPRLREHHAMTKALMAAEGNRDE